MFALKKAIKFLNSRHVKKPRAPLSEQSIGASEERKGQQSERKAKERHSKAKEGRLKGTQKSVSRGYSFNLTMTVLEINC